MIDIVHIKDPLQSPPKIFKESSLQLSSRVSNNYWATFSAKGKILMVAIRETIKLGSSIVCTAFMATSFTIEQSSTPSSALLSSWSSFSSLASSVLLLPARTSFLFLNQKWKHALWESSKIYSWGDRDLWIWDGQKIEKLKDRKKHTYKGDCFLS